MAQQVNINGKNFIKIGNNGFVVSRDIYEQFTEDFWDIQKVDLTISQHKKFAAKIEKLLIDRERLQLEIDQKGAGNVLQALLDRSGQHSVIKAEIPPMYRKQDAAQLFVPAKNKGMLINAVKAAEVNGGSDAGLIVLCIEDASHYEDGFRGLFMMNCYRKWRLVSEDGQKIWDVTKNKRVPAIMRYNGFYAAQFPTDEVGVYDDKTKTIEPIDRIILESSFDGVSAANEYSECIKNNQDPYEFGGPVAYYPKTERPEDLALLNEILSERDKATNLPKGASKIAMVLEDTKQMVMIEQAIEKANVRVIMVSFGRYDAVDANIGVHRANANQVPPGPDSMNITNAPAIYQVGKMVQVLAKHGVVIVGGMADMVRDDDPVIENKARDRVISDKTREASQGATSSWCSSPFQVPYVSQGLGKGRGNLEAYKEMCQAGYNVGQIVEFPKGVITEEEIERFVIRKGLEFFEGYLRGIGCVPIRDLTGANKPEWSTMDDFATGGRFQGMFAWIVARFQAEIKMKDGSVKKFDQKVFRQKIQDAVDAIENNYKLFEQHKNSARQYLAKGIKASAASFAQSKYKEAAKMFIDIIESNVCPNTVKDEFAWPEFLSINGRTEQAAMVRNRIERIRESSRLNY